TSVFFTGVFFCPINSNEKFMPNGVEMSPSLPTKNTSVFFTGVFFCPINSNEKFMPNEVEVSPSLPTKNTLGN
ncbi:hypothetical protein, partial [Putridiphycobacter roseus]|uniref:hypothetical protein n=1 Tax=Putridiphycobacter roseus TaxID=2219161 RepID=UPI00362CEEB1